MRLAVCFLLTLSVAGRAATYYVSNSGNDSNAGTSAASPWQTLAKVNATKFHSGESVLLQAGGHWHEQLQCINATKATAGTTLASAPPPCAGLTIGRYGAGVAPLIDGADELKLEWSPVASGTYAATYSGQPPLKLYVDSPARQSDQLLPVPNARGEYDPSATYNQFDAVTSSGSLYVRGALPPSSKAGVNNPSYWVGVTNTNPGNTSQTFSATNSGLQNVQATPGSWYVDGQKIYVHLKDGSSASGHTFQGTRRPYGVLLQGVNNVSVTGLAIEHVLHSCVASIPYSSDQGSYFVGEYNKVTEIACWNFGSLTSDNLPLQEHSNVLEAGILFRSSGAASPHLVRGNLAANNKVGTMDSYRGLRAQRNQAGIIASGVDGGGAANTIVLQKNYIATVNAQGIIYSTIGVTQKPGVVLLNNGGRVTGNELVNNQGNIFFTATAGGMEDHNLVHHSFGEGVQTGGGSTSTPAVPQTHAFDILYHLGKSASGTLYNGFDCNGGFSGGYWLNNTVYDTNSAAMTFEGGCDSSHVHNNLLVQGVKNFPAYDSVNRGYLVYYVSGSSHVNPDWSNNLYVNGTNAKPFMGTADNANCSTFFQFWPDTNSSCISDVGLANPEKGDFSLRPGSPAMGKGMRGADIGATARDAASALATRR